MKKEEGRPSAFALSIAAEKYSEVLSLKSAKDPVHLRERILSACPPPWPPPNVSSVQQISTGALLTQQPPARDPALSGVDLLLHINAVLSDHSAASDLSSSASCASSSKERKFVLGKRDRKKHFGERPDVVHKTILRSFKKKYLTDFNEHSDYKRKKRRISSKHDPVELARNYVQTTFPANPFPDLEYFVAALVQPRMHKSNADDSFLQGLGDAVYSVLYNFNKQKMRQLLSYKQFAFLLLDFLSSPHAEQEIAARSEHSKHSDVYQNQIRYLKGKCIESLQDKLSGYDEEEFFLEEALREQEAAAVDREDQWNLAPATLFPAVRNDCC